MKSRIRLISLLLLLAMLVTVSGCGKTAASTPAELETPAPTEAPKPAASEVYAELAEASGALSDYKIAYTSEVVRVINGEDYSVSDSAVLNVVGSGTEDMSALLKDSRTLKGYNCKYLYDFTRSYSDDTAFYTDTYDSAFYSDMSGEDFLGILTPVVLFDAEKYGSIDYGEDGETIIFGDASALEDWVGCEYAEEISAVGSVTPGENGCIDKAEYTAFYSIAGIEYSIQYSMALSDGADDISAALGGNVLDCVYVSDIRVPDFMKYAECLFSVRDVSAALSYVISSEAAGAAVVSDESINLYGGSSDLLFKDKINETIYSAEGTQQTEIDASFKDGVYTYAQDGVEDSFEANGAEISKNIRTAVLGYWPAVSGLASAVLTDADDCWLIEFDGSESFGEAMDRSTENALFANSSLLTGLASSYSTDLLNGHISIDKDTMLPIALYVDYSGTHVIDGDPYILDNTISIKYDISPENVYYNINDELLPEEAPENPATPLFYEVTSPEGGKMWLLGTIHVGDSRTAFLPQKVYDAFNAADALAVECDVDAFSDLIEDDESLQETYLNAYTYSDGTYAADHLEEELFDELQLALKKYGSYILYDLVPYKVSLWESTVSGEYMSLGRALSPNKGVDTRLLKLARDAEKEILEVESVEFQMEMLGGFSDIIQSLLLESTLETNRYEYNNDLAVLFEMWCEGNEDELRAYLNSDEEIESDEATEEEIAAYEEYNDQMLIKRNDNMLKVAQEYMASGKTVFYAVGLAHLIGENGLVDTLREAGYTVELVAY